MNYNIEYEEVVLTAAKRNNIVYDESGLKPEDFYDSRNVKMWQAIGDLVGSGVVADDISITDKGVQASYVSGLDSPGAANWRYCAGKIKELAILRQYESLTLKLFDKLKGNVIIFRCSPIASSICSKIGSGTRDKVGNFKAAREDGKLSKISKPEK